MGGVPTLPKCPSPIPQLPRGRKRGSYERTTRRTERLVEDGRAFAKIIAAPFEREKTRDAREKFIDIQVAIEAVDRAIEDEDRQVVT